ncbi:MAG: 50S ribosomal protein L11 methyltransferase [Bacteroidia bacterium]
MNSYLLFEIICDESTKDILIAELGEIGFEGFLEGDEGFEAYLPKSEWIESDFIEVLEKYHIAKESVKAKEIEQQNWNAQWESEFQPVTIEDQIRISAPFHGLNKEFPYELIIQPKTSFGTGHHETTFLIMKLMLNEEWNQKSVFDFGAGTGILSILASQLGAHTIYANDIDDWASENISENAGFNQINNIVFKKGGLEILVDEKFDIILANINKNVLMSSFAKLAIHANENTKLFISGFYTSDLSDLKSEAENLGWNMIESFELNGWCAAKFKF